MDECRCVARYLSGKSIIFGSMFEVRCVDCDEFVGFVSRKFVRDLLNLFKVDSGVVVVSVESVRGVESLRLDVDELVELSER